MAESTQEPRTGTGTPLVSDWIAEAEQTVRARDAAAFPVAPRIVRRVIRSELDIGSQWIRLPHRKSCIIDRDRLLWLVAADELGVSTQTILPGKVILLARPEETDLRRIDRRELLLEYWRVLFHARIDAALQELCQSDELSETMVRERIDRIGQIRFDEVRQVLMSEMMLMHPDDLRHVYCEFVAVWFELKFFLPELLPYYFPAFDVDEESLNQLLATGFHPEELLEKTRFPELTDADRDPPTEASQPANVSTPFPRPLGKISRSRSDRLLKLADLASAKGNVVRGALLRQQASEVAPSDQEAIVEQSLQNDLRELSLRLMDSLEMDRSRAEPWQGISRGLLPDAIRGFWNFNARILYDLQNVCLAREQRSYRVDLWSWLVTRMAMLAWFITRGRFPLRQPEPRPLREELPYQHLVMMARGLRVAEGRVQSVTLPESQRPELNRLLGEAIHSAEQLLRRELRPLLRSSLEEVGLIPQSTSEEVAFEKLIEELLDDIAERGFIGLGQFRDALSRNQLKLPDLLGAREWFSGDPLLRADRKLSRRLIGIYQRGPVYLRLFQRLSSLFFGFEYGRLFTKFVGLPFGGAFIVVKGFLHLIDEVHHLLGRFFEDDEPVGAKSAIQGHSKAKEEIPVKPVDPEPPPQIEVKPPQVELPPTANAAPDGAAEVMPPVEHVPEMLPDATIDGVDPLFEDSVHRQIEHSQHSLFPPELAWWGTGILGIFFLLLIHVPVFRATVVRFCQLLWMTLRLFLYDLFRKLLRFQFVQNMLRSFPVVLVRQYLWSPLLVSLLVWRGFPILFHYKRPNDWWSLAVFAVIFVALNSRMGRDTEEVSSEWLGQWWYRIRVHVVVGLFNFIVDLFRQILDIIERVLYYVDEQLRFRSGESSLTLGVKAVVGLLWGIVHGVIRFCVTLLIEPQINPIKHFPVVTVSHKLLLPTIPVFAGLLMQATKMNKESAYFLMTVIITAIPGIFGFLAWELKENWRLYAANRNRNLKPVRIGHHGETLAGLLLPGFHSGTIPKLFRKRRKWAKTTLRRRNRIHHSKFDSQLHHVEERLIHFVERDLFLQLKKSTAWKEVDLSVSHVHASANSVTLELESSQCPGHPLAIQFCEQSGWLMARIAEPGWLNHLSDDRLRLFHAALDGFYQLGSVNLVREHIADSLGSEHAWDVADAGLIVWPHRQYSSQAIYPMDDDALLSPRPRSLSKSCGLEPLPREKVMYHEHHVEWTAWRNFWTESATTAIKFPAEFATVPILPEVDSSRS